MPSKRSHPAESGGTTKSGVRKSLDMDTKIKKGYVGGQTVRVVAPEDVLSLSFDSFDDE